MGGYILYSSDVKKRWKILCYIPLLKFYLATKIIILITILNEFSTRAKIAVISSMAFPAWQSQQRTEDRKRDIQRRANTKGTVISRITIDDRSLNASNLRTLTRRSLTEARTYSRIYFCDHSHRKHELTLVSLECLWTRSLNKENFRSKANEGKGRRRRPRPRRLRQRRGGRNEGRKWWPRVK